MSSIGASWAVAKTHPSREDRAKHDLERLGLVCYLPKFLDRVSFHGRVVGRKALLYPGYLFFAISEQWKRIFERPSDERSVIGVLGTANEPAPIPGSFVAELQRYEVGGYIDMSRFAPREEEPRKFRRGQLVKVTCGSFVSMEGVFDCYYRGEQVKVLIDVMGREASVLLRDEDLVPLDITPRARRKFRQRRRRLEESVYTSVA